MHSDEILYNKQKSTHSNFLRNINDSNNNSRMHSDEVLYNRSNFNSENNILAEDESNIYIKHTDNINYYKNNANSIHDRTSSRQTTNTKSFEEENFNKKQQYHFRINQNFENKKYFKDEYNVNSSANTDYSTSSQDSIEETAVIDSKNIHASHKLAENQIKNYYRTNLGAFLETKFPNDYNKHPNLNYSMDLDFDIKKDYLNRKSPVESKSYIECSEYNTTNRKSPHNRKDGYSNKQENMKEGYYKYNTLNRKSPNESMFYFNKHNNIDDGQIDMYNNIKKKSPVESMNINDYNNDYNNEFINRKSNIDFELRRPIDRISPGSNNNEFINRKSNSPIPINNENINHSKIAYNKELDPSQIIHEHKNYNMKESDMRILNRMNKDSSKNSYYS